MSFTSRTTSLLLVSPLLISLLTACGVDPTSITESEGEDDVETSSGELSTCNARDIGGLTEGSPEAMAVLFVANQSTVDALRTSGKLTRAAAIALVKRRDGADATRGTADDRPFSTLSDLSSVCGIGSASIRSLLTWASGQGLVSAAPGAGCAGPPAIPTAYVSITNANQQWFSRSCDANGTCEAWRAYPIVELVPDNGPNSITFEPRGSFAVSYRIGPVNVAQFGSDRYECSSHEMGSGSVDPSTGVGSMSITPTSRCNISGGSGGPWNMGAARWADARAGQRCLSFVDRFDASAPGFQAVGVTTLRW
ncbi:MAG: hypothetical protein JST00_20985 [Deltaproteobacteria bacterium]|nr:hypothetical protein [Deltaproteobacteria bacterium]